ncbi:MAG TPA: hypothetical protein VNT79_14485 [Phycisphaerae bacterium]|nr:hypothetical protein [Phycisphaerae bacterium]
MVLQLSLASWLLIQVLAESFNQFWKLDSRHFPDNIVIDIQIVMNDSMSHADDVSPRNFGVRCAKRLAHTSGRLSNVLYEMRDHNSQIFFCIEVWTLLADKSKPNLLAEVKDVANVNAIILLHKAPARNSVFCLSIGGSST